jgi:membrane fusion protein (multidrug efflux system)
VNKGDSVSYSFGSQMQSYKGVVYAIEPTIDANTRSIRIRSYCYNTMGKVLPGAFAKVRLQLSSATTLMVPTESIVPVLKGKQVFVVRSGKADTVSVVTGTRNDVLVPILSGLQAGDSVITTGILQLRPGSDVKIKKK